MPSRAWTVLFFMCAYVSSWTCWLSVAASRWWGWGLPLSKEHLLNLGQFGPFASAILLTVSGTGRAGLRELFSRLVLWRVNPA